MTEARIAHAHPDLSDDQALLALLGETLEMARDLEITRRGLQEKSGAELSALVKSAGLPEEIESAAKAAQTTVLEILSRISEQALEAGRDKGFLSPEDYREALKAKRTLSLSRGRATERENGREA